MTMNYDLFIKLHHIMSFYNIIGGSECNLKLKSMLLTYLFVRSGT